MKLILASNSPRRKELLRSFGFKYKVIVPSIDENIAIKNPPGLVKKLAFQKAFSVLSRLNDRDKKQEDILILGADTVVVLKNKIIGKPSSLKEGIKILKMLSSSVHSVYTGVALIDVKNNRYMVSYDRSRVKMRRLERAEIINAARRHKDKAGAYAVQEKNDAFVKEIKGDYYNVVGLPIKLLSGMIKTLRPQARIPARVRKIFSSDGNPTPDRRFYIKLLS